MTWFKNIPSGRIGKLLGGAALASVIGGTAIAITSPDFTYSTTKNGYFSLGVMAMAPSNAQAADDYSMSYPNQLSGLGCFQTAVNLPQGASLVSVTNWYRSNATSDLRIYLLRHNLTTNAYNILLNVSVADNANTRKVVTYTVPAALRSINNLYFAYGYAVCVYPGTTFSGARINYTYRSAGD